MNGIEIVLTPQKMIEYLTKQKAVFSYLGQNYKIEKQRNKKYPTLYLKTEEYSYPLRRNVSKWLFLTYVEQPICLDKDFNKELEEIMKSAF